VEPHRHQWALEATSLGRIWLFKNTKKAQCNL
jgi:hypothetical protein